VKPSPAVAVYRGDAVTAAEICSVLGGSGVDARMQTTFGFRASGGRVMVPSSQAERALEVLKAYGFLHEADPSRPRAVFTARDAARLAQVLAVILGLAFVLTCVVLWAAPKGLDTRPF